MPCEMQSLRSRIWTRVAVFICYDDNHYTTGTSMRKISKIICACFNVFSAYRYSFCLKDWYAVKQNNQPANNQKVKYTRSKKKPTQVILQIWWLQNKWPITPWKPLIVFHKNMHAHWDRKNICTLKKHWNMHLLFLIFFFWAIYNSYVQN